MTLTPVGQYFGIFGVGIFSGVVDRLVCSMHISIRDERITVKTRTPEHVPVAGDIKVKGVNSTGSNIKNEGGCAPGLDKGKLTPESVVSGGSETFVPGVGTIWGYLPQSGMVLDTNCRATETSNEVWKMERWQLASL